MEKTNVDQSVSEQKPRPPQPSQPQPTKKGGNTGLVVAIVIISIVVVAGLGIGGWYGYKALKKSLKTGSQTSPSTTASTATITSTTTTTTTGSSTKAGTMPTNGYVIGDSNTRVIDASELTSLTPWQLKVARNEIYARLGRPFVHKDLQCYFAKQSWYKEDQNFTESSLSTTEKRNIETIKSYEIKTNSPLFQKDSGC